MKLSSLLFLLIVYKSFSQNIPPEFKNPIVFIQIEKDGKWISNGTGFFISVPTSDSSGAHNYLVTAKHVIQKPKSSEYYNEVAIRINTRDTSFARILLPLFTNGIYKNIFVNQDQSVDLAVIPFGADPKLYKYQTIAESFFFTTKKDFDSSYISEGTNIFFTGLFTAYQGYKTNKPITRFGRVALLSKDEGILWDSTDKYPSNLFLVETTTFGGNSGSPVFSYDSEYSFNGNISIGSPQIRGAGVIKGYSGEQTPVNFTPASSSILPTYTSNVGITAVIPSYLISEILHSRELTELRLLHERQFFYKREKK